MKNDGVMPVWKKKNIFFTHACKTLVCAPFIDSENSTLWFEGVKAAIRTYEHFRVYEFSGLWTFEDMNFRAYEILGI